VADVDRAEVAFNELVDELASLEESNPTWLDIATRLLTFCHKFPPPSTAWDGLDSDEVWDAILDLELSAAADLRAVDAAFFAPAPLSSASREHVRALLATAKSALVPKPFGDTRLSLAVVARALAGAIDNLAGSTYLTFFKSLGEMTIKEGEPYPVCSHDPCPWLPDRKANTNPKNRPKRDLSFTPSLRIATGPFGFTYVLDFNFWDRLSPLGTSSKGLVMAAAQTNFKLGDFDTKYAPSQPGKLSKWYANRGPRNDTQQVDRITRLIGAAMAEGAELVLMPEYAASESAYKTLDGLPGSDFPRVFCIGISRPDTNDYVKNQAWLRVSTPGISPSYSTHFHAKTSGAKLLGAITERIRLASEIRVFVSQNWSLCVLICVEVLADGILEQLAKMGTNLLLVPAMSEKTNSMVADVSTLCQDSQAFVVMANGPAEWWTEDGQDPPCEAFFAGPYGNAPSSWETRFRDAGRQPDQIAAWVLPVLQKTVSLHQLPR